VTQLIPRPATTTTTRPPRTSDRSAPRTAPEQPPSPAPRPRRWPPCFADPAWTANPVYRRLPQEYVAVTGSLGRLVDDLETRDGDWREVEQARFVVNALTSAMAPTNTLAGNPAALERVRHR